MRSNARPLRNTRHVAHSPDADRHQRGVVRLRAEAAVERLQDVRRRLPDKPGASITKTEMCSCSVCEPAACCHELEQDAPEVQKDCANGYDFSKCEMAVSSCESSCFQHRWRTRVEVGCAGSRPATCCHDQADF
jgi:hypothetical protein